MKQYDHDYQHVNGGSELTWYEQDFLSIHWCRATHTCKLRYERRV